MNNTEGKKPKPQFIKVNVVTFVRMFKALDDITHYQSPEKLQKDSENDWGLGYEESLAMAYENMQGIAKDGIRGIRLKKILSQLQPKTLQPSQQ